jgi:hypothetical protein
MRHLAFISALAILIAGCGATGPSASVPESSPVRTALPTPATTTTATPAAIPAVTPAATPISTPSPSPKIVAGWPKVSRGGVTMTGGTVYEEQPYGAAGDPVIRVKVTGLASGEVVTLSGTGRYDRAVFCGPVPSGCREDTPVVEPPPGQPNCMPPYSEQAKGRVTISERATADAGGTARATLRFVMPETKEACPVAGGEPGWYPLSGEWKVRVTDQAHGLRLAPDEYLYGP